MKKLFTLSATLLLFGLKAQTLSIGAFTIVPANPTTSDQVLVLTNVTTPNWGAKVAQSQSVSGNTHLLNGCYWPGMLTALRTIIDTFNLGQLSAGNYAVAFTANTSSSFTSCVITNSTSSNTSFVVTPVSVPTGLPEHDKSVVKLWPNPVHDKLYLSSVQKFETVRITDVSGRLVKEIVPGREEEVIDVRDLNPGCYLLQFSGQSGVGQSRFVKLDSN